MSTVVADGRSICRMSPITSRTSSRPGFAALARRSTSKLAQPFRLILFDERRTGLSHHGGSSLPSDAYGRRAPLSTSRARRMPNRLRRARGSLMAGRLYAARPERHALSSFFTRSLTNPRGIRDFSQPHRRSYAHTGARRCSCTEILAPALRSRSLPSMRSGSGSPTGFESGPAPPAYALHRARIRTDLRECHRQSVCRRWSCTGRRAYAERMPVT